MYRNLASHEVHPEVRKEDAKLMIEIMLKLLNGLCDSSIALELFNNE